MKNIQKTGFTLIELLVALTIAVILLGFIAPNFFSILQKTKDETALRRAALLDIAKTSFRSEKGNPFAYSAWSNTANDEDKYTILKDYLVNPPKNLGSGSSGDNYAPSGYVFRLNELSNVTTVIRTKGNETLISP